MLEENFMVEEMEEEEEEDTLMNMMNKSNQITIKNTIRVEFNVTIIKSIVI